MKVLLVIGGLSFGGAERVISNLANSLSNNGDDVTLVGMFTKEAAYKLNNNIHFINGVNGKSSLDSILKLRKIIKMTEPDVLLSFLTHINIATIIANFALKIPIVISERNDPSRSPSQISRKIMRSIFYPFASGIVFQTKEAQEYFSKKIQKKSVVIPNSLNLENLVFGNDREEIADEVSCELKNEIKIISVGRLVPQKRHNKVIEVFSEILNENQQKNYKLEIWGEGPERKNIENLIEELNIKENVLLMGESEKIHHEMRKASIFVMYSEFEGMPNSLIEAMALGLPVISSNCRSGGPNFLIDNNINGILTPLNDAKQLKKSIKMLLENEAMRSALGSNAKQVKEKLDPVVINKQWRDYLYANKQ